MAAQLILATWRPSVLGRTTLAGTAAGPRSATLARPLVATSRFAPSVRRLVVLVPDAETNEAGFATHLWTAASAGDLAILLLGVCSDPGREPRARRRLATLAALIRDDRVHVDTRLEVGADWFEAVGAVHQNTDLVVCHAEQRVARWGFQRKPLSQLLTAKLNEPVCVMAGFYPDLPPEHPGLFGQAIRWAVPILIVAAFTALEVLIHRTSNAGTHTVLMSLCVLVEYGLVGGWVYLSI